MAVEFDPAKDAKNIVRHGISLTRAKDLIVESRVIDTRYDEPRLRAYGTIDGERYCLAYTLRGPNLRAISLRRAHLKEYGRHVP